MQPAPGILDSQGDEKNRGDLFFKCGSCGIPLVVDCAAVGMTLTCQHCGNPTTVPAANDIPTEFNGATAEWASKGAELQSHLKENESQRTEITGYINQLNIQLHRWQLRLQTLNDRNKELKTEIARLGAVGDSPPL